LKAKSTGLLTLGAKLREDVMFAKREVAYGHLGETDIHELHKLLTAIIIPITGLSTMADITERTHCGRNHATPAEKSDIRTDTGRIDWEELFQGLSGSFDAVVQILDESLLHTLLLLKLVPSPKKPAGDIEASAGAPKPGEMGFGDYLEQRIADFRKERSADLATWAQEKGLNDVFKNTAKYSKLPGEFDHNAEDAQEVIASRRLHIVLYMEYLLYNVSLAILAIVRFSELKVLDGTMGKKRIIAPAYRTLKKIVRGLISGEEPGPDTQDMEVIGNTVEGTLGDSFQAPKDPEHLPPKNRHQVWGNYVRAIPKFLGSDPVRFGVRVTIGVMSIGIMAYLKK